MSDHFPTIEECKARRRELLLAIYEANLSPESLELEHELEAVEDLLADHGVNLDRLREEEPSP